MASAANPSDQEALTAQEEYDKIWKAKHELAQERRVEIDEYIDKLQQLFKEIDKNVQGNAISPYDNQGEASEKRVDLSNCRDSVLLTITNQLKGSAYDTGYVRPRIILSPTKPRTTPK